MSPSQLVEYHLRLLDYFVMSRPSLLDATKHPETIEEVLNAFNEDFKNLDRNLDATSATKTLDRANNELLRAFINASERPDEQLLRHQTLETVDAVNESLWDFFSTYRDIPEGILSEITSKVIKSLERELDLAINGLNPKRFVEGNA